MVNILLILGGAVFLVFGNLHALYTVLDLRNPRRLVPVDPSVAQAMADTALRLSPGDTNMWRAWIGFNFSHSVGVLLVGALAVWAGIRISTLPSGIMPALKVVPTIVRHHHHQLTLCGFYPIRLVAVCCSALQRISL